MIAEETIREIKKLPKEELAKGEAYLRRILVRDDPLLLIHDEKNILREPNPCLYIKTKDKGIIPLVLNKAQKHILRIFKKLWDAGEPIRIIMLKARQVGSTTFWMAVIWAIESQADGESAAVIADEKGKANDVFDMAKLFQDRCQPYLRPETKKSNERKLEFAGTRSQIVIDTAENKDAGRSATLRHVLMTEYAYYRKANADALLLGISNSMPSLPRTIRVKESSANGYNHFKDEWDAAESGVSGEVPIFVLWYWDEGYRMPADEGFIPGDGSLGDATQDEPALARQMANEDIEFINERLAWRRWCIRINCKGSVDKFKQEFPSTPEEAFLASGSCFFDQKKLVAQLKRAGPPLFRANILKENFKWVTRKCSDGDFYFYEEVNPYEEYAIGGDACSGSGTDYGPLVAVKRSTKQPVIVYHAKSDPDELAYRAMCLGSLLNNAKVAIENDKFGFAANQKLLTIYGNIYVKRTYDKTTNKQTETFGWDTTSATRPMILSNMQEKIREGNLKIPHEGAIRECLSFIKNPETGRAEAEPGKNDDLVIATAIALQLCEDEPYQVKDHERESRNRVREFDSVERRNAGMGFKKASA